MQRINSIVLLGVEVMRNNIINISLIKYEIRNIVGNIFNIIFGVLFPVVMSCFLGPIFMKNVPEEMKSHIFTSYTIGVSTLIPLAVTFIGNSALYSIEVEKGIPLRFNLFGYKQYTIVISKVIAYTIFITISIMFYTIINYILLDIEVPSFSSGIILIISLYMLTIVSFIFSHGLALFFKSFNKTFAIAMVIYFLIMILSGLFGANPKDFPDALGYISYLLPTTYISQEFITFWKEGSYNFGPYIQSVIFFTTIASLILLLGIKKDSRYK